MFFILEIILFIIIIFAIICLVVSHFDTRRFVIKNYDIDSDKVTKDLKICLLTDLHGMTYGKDNIDLISKIDENSPDIVIIAGDIITASHPEDSFAKEKKFLRNISKKYKVYVANGNHEYKTKKLTDIYGDFYDEYKAYLESIGIVLLENDSINLHAENIHLTGLELAHYYFGHFYKRKMEKDYLEKTIGIADKDKCNILIAHNPQYFEEYAAWGADITVSGHVHGGIMKLPILGGVISPALILFPKYDGGKFEHQNKNMILSRGLGVHTIKLRIFNPGELVFINIKRFEKR